MVGSSPGLKTGADLRDLVATHADGDTIDGIPRQHALVLDRREIDEECIAEMRAAYERSIARRATIIDAEPIRGS
jgi:hypothetical protein